MSKKEAISQEIVFDPISPESVKAYYDDAMIFHEDRAYFSEQVLVRNKFKADEGSSAQDVTIYLYDSDNGFRNIADLVDLESRFTEVEGSGSGYFIMGDVMGLLDAEGIEYSEFLVITRTMSSYMFDSKNHNLHAAITKVCDTQLGSILHMLPSLAGYLSKKRVKLGNITDVLDLLDEDFTKGKISQYTYLNYRGSITDLIGDRQQ